MATALRYYWIVTVSGAVVMALEILSIRILAPTFGNSVYTWGSIISVFLAAMSLGYVLGGRLVDRSPSLVPLGQVLLLAGFFQALLLFGALWMAEALGDLTERISRAITTAPETVTIQ